VGKLENLARLRAESDTYQSYQLAAFDDDSKIRRSFKVVVGPENYAFLVWRDSGEEVVLQVQGMLVSCSLPPLSSKTKYVHLKFSILSYTTGVSLGFRPNVHIL
jgi:hypothetical protein